MPKHRPSWDEYFLKIAEEVATRSPCLRRSVGAVFVREKQILATGYNGPPKGVSHCSSAGCIREKLKIPSGQRLDICRAIHAEANGIIQAAAHGVSVQGSTLYCTTTPCFGCSKALINAGIIRIVVSEGYSDELGTCMLNEVGIHVEVLGNKEDPITTDGESTTQP